MTFKPIHGHCSGGYLNRTPTYNSWRAMRQRVLNPKHEMFSHYGGRGITIDPRWDSFQEFLKDMGERPTGKTLDRIDVNGNYCKENCKWSTKKQQQRNKR